jgi:hypothetical protein
MRSLQRDGYRLGEDCTVAALLDRHGQHGSLRRHLWEALCLAALNTAPGERASAQIFANMLRDSLGGASGDRSAAAGSRPRPAVAGSRCPLHRRRVAATFACRAASKESTPA